MFSKDHLQGLDDCQSAPSEGTKDQQSRSSEALVSIDAVDAVVLLRVISQRQAHININHHRRGDRVYSSARSQHVRRFLPSASSLADGLILFMCNGFVEDSIMELLLKLLIVFHYLGSCFHDMVSRMH